MSIEDKKTLILKEDTKLPINPVEERQLPSALTALGNLKISLEEGTISGADGAILDGVSASIKATVLDYTNSNPIAVRLTDINGDYVGAGGGEQYPDAEVVGAAKKGNLILGTDGSNYQILSTTDDGKLHTRGFRLSNGSPARMLVDAARHGQVDVITMPTVAVTGTFWQTTQPVSGTITVNAGTNLNTSALLTETVFTGRIGEVQASPTANTILDRLKTIASNQLSDGHNVTVDNAVDAGVYVRPGTGAIWDVADRAARLVGKVYGSQSQILQQKVTSNDLIVTLDGESVAVTGSFYQATQPVSVAASVAVTGTFWQATQPISVASLPLPSGAATSAKQLADNHNVTVSNPTADPETGLATETKQDNAITELQKLIGFEITAYDYIALTYVAAGNGAGEVETAVYKTGGAGGSTVATLTLAYNVSDEISSITKS